MSNSDRLKFRDRLSSLELYSGLDGLIEQLYGIKEQYKEKYYNFDIDYEMGYYDEGRTYYVYGERFEDENVWLKRLEKQEKLLKEHKKKTRKQNQERDLKEYARLKAKFEKKSTKSST